MCVKAMAKVSYPPKAALFPQSLHLRRLLKDGAEHIWVFLSTKMPFWAETETVAAQSRSLHAAFLYQHTHPGHSAFLIILD